MGKKKKNGFLASIMAGVKAGIEEALNEIAENQNRASNADPVANTPKNGANKPSHKSAQTRKIEIIINNNEDDIKSDSKESSKFEHIGKNAHDIQTIEIKVSLAQALKGLASILSSSDIVETVKDKTFRSFKRFERFTGCDIKNSGVSEAYANIGFKVRGTRLISCDRRDAFIEIPDGIIEIGEFALANNESVNHITLSNSIQRIGAYAFCGCSNLRQIDIAEGVEEIGESAFQTCTSLKTVVLPESIKRINKGAFAACTSLEKVVFPRNIEIIEDDVFEYCISLIDVNWPDQIKQYGNGIFTKCCSSDSPLDYFELQENALVRVHNDMEEWSKAHGSLICGSRLVSRSLLDLFYLLYGKFITSEIHRNGENIIYNSLKLVEFVTNNDPYAMINAIRNIIEFIGNADRFRWDDPDDRNLIIYNVLTAIGGDGSAYRSDDQDWKDNINTCYDGHIRDILGTFDEQEGAIPEEDVDIYVFPNDETDEMLIVSPEKTPESGEKRLSPEEIESYVLWLHALEDLGAVPSTQRYNPRVCHYTFALQSGYIYWNYVDVIEGLIRGAGFERVRYSPTNVSEGDSVDAWSVAWSRAMADEAPMSEETLSIARYRYYLRFHQNDQNYPEYYDIYMIMKRRDAVTLREMLTAIELDQYLNIWCNGEEVTRLRMV